MRRREPFLFLLALVVAACQSTERKPTPAAVPEPTPAIRELVILYTNDEHGWMEATEESGGAPGMMGLWRTKEGYSEDGPFLVLSGGDMWTGPAISTWFDGESMVEVMNAMGYAAAAIGNHEFDFGLRVLGERAAQAEFPFLSANIRDKETGQVASQVAIPYVVQEVNGVRVGLIGLTTIRAPQIVMPGVIADLNFTGYRQALQEIVPQVRAEGADLLMVVGHICSMEMRALAPVAAELGISVIGGGHCHETYNQVVDGVALIEAGDGMKNYVRVNVTVNVGERDVIQVEPQLRRNTGGEPDPAIQAVVDGWREQADQALSHVIGYLERPLARGSAALLNLVTDAWLEAYPAADVALTNEGGFRQDIPAGPITLATIVGVLPFDNVLLDVGISGAQLVENLQCASCGPVVGGMTTVGGYRLADGTPIDRDMPYHLLTTDFVYGGGDGFRFNEYDADVYQTTIDWRQPVIDWILARKSSPENPLDGYLDSVDRQ